MNGVTLSLATTFVLSTAAANVLMKKAMTTPGISPGISLDLVRSLLTNTSLWGGLVSYAVALAMYLALLARVPLNVATSIASLNFVVVLLASRLVLGEPIPSLRYLGFACILLGMYVVSLTQYEGL